MAVVSFIGHLSAFVYVDINHKKIRNSLDGVGDSAVLSADDAPQAHRAAQGEEDPGYVFNRRGPYHRQLAGQLMFESNFGHLESVLNGQLSD